MDAHRQQLQLNLPPTLSFEVFVLFVLRLCVCVLNVVVFFWGRVHFKRVVVVFTQPNPR